MTKSEWLGLKKYLDEHGIEYRTLVTCISGEVSSFVVELPPVTCYRNNPKELENAYPELTKAWTDLWNAVKRVL